jgi:vanadium-dependent haloperoxidase-like protein
MNATGTRAVTLMLFAMLAAFARADVITDWNTRADAIATDKRLLPPVHGRVLAMMHVAMFEAVNAIEHRYAPYRLKLVADKKTSGDTAAAVAGHDVLVALFPEQKSALDALLAESVGRVAEGPARERGIILGHKAAEGILELRVSDGSDVAETYRPITKPGVYVPTALPVSSTVSGFTPWVMSSAAQFRPPPPPALTSETWTRDFNEIREIGELNSKTRSAGQTEIAKFWFLTGARTFNPIVQQVAKHRQMDLLDCARLFALVSMAAEDAFIAVFDAKYTFNFWRPVTAIRNADLNGNPGTPREAGWLPLGDTPMHPEYPCAHCITSAAVAAVLQGVVGDDVGEITLTSATAPGVVRRWTSLDDYRDEVSNARVWAGFHYRFSTEAGKDMGKRIGELTVATQLRRRK